MGTFAIGCFCMVIASTIDIKCILFRLNEISKKKKDRAKAMKKLTEYIEVQSATKELSQQPDSYLNEGFLFQLKIAINGIAF